MINAFNSTEKKTDLFLKETENRTHEHFVWTWTQFRKAIKWTVRRNEWMNEMDKMSWRCKIYAYIHSVCCVPVCMKENLFGACKTNVSLYAHEYINQSTSCLFVVIIQNVTTLAVTDEQRIATPINELGTVFQRQNILRLATMNLEYEKREIFENSHENAFEFLIFEQIQIIYFFIWFEFFGTITS